MSKEYIEKLEITENEYPTEDDNSIINLLSAIDGFEIHNSINILEKKHIVELSNKLIKASKLIESVIKNLKKRKIDFIL